MLKKTKILLVSLLISATSFGSVNAFASEKNTQVTDSIVKIVPTAIEKEPSYLLEDIGKMSIKEKLKVGDISVPLFVTFDSQDKALKNISKNPVIQEIQKIYKYQDISNDNWHDYYEALYNLMDSPSRPTWYTEENIDFNMLSSFFDIYENEEKNNEIRSLAMTSIIADNIVDKENLLELLPYNSYIMLSKKLQVQNNIDSLTRSKYLGMDLDKAISYAANHATSPNNSEYEVFSKDCTNFASQILEKGGVSQEKYNDEKKGWWHTKTNISFVVVHHHSISWINADTFARYMGVGYTTESNALFSENIQKGDFITYDEGNDGDWNHIGFVTDKKSSRTNGYYDYRVAQHTPNYHKWTSSTDNHWEEIGRLYGRIRR